MAWAVCLAWLVAHVATLIAVPAESGLPTWSSPEALFGARWAVVLRLALMGCLGWLCWGWVRRRLRLEGDIGRLWRVGGSLTLAFVVFHVVHVGHVFRVADPIATQRLPELNDRLAATLSGTYGGVPWFSFAYLVGSIAAGILCGVEVWLLSASRGVSSDSWRRRRTRRFLAVCAGALVGSACLRALLFFATGARLWH